MDNDFLDLDPVSLPSLVEVRPVFSRRTAIFRVPTARAGDVFMCADLGGYRARENAVVEVDAQRFLSLWRQPYSSHPEVASGNAASWPRDYKYELAEEGFSHGAANPVPLAEVGCHVARVDVTEQRRRFLFFKETIVVGATSSPYLGFSDGVTRTIWLLTQGAARFPVRCSRAEAALLQELAGVARGRPWTLHELDSAAGQG